MPPFFFAISPLRFDSPHLHNSPFIAAIATLSPHDGYGMGTHSVVCCDRDAISHGLCLRHYKAARSKHASEPSPRIGQPVGAGVYGRLSEDAEGRLICHECGTAYLSLAAHVYLAHGMTAAEYRETYELPRTTKLAAPSVRQQISRSSSKPKALARLARVRDPQAAADARTADTFRALSRTQRSRHVTPPK